MSYATINKYDCIQRLHADLLFELERDIVLRAHDCYCLGFWI